jgi:hypothetical protein
MIINVEEVFAAIKERHRINAVPIEEVTWMHYGREISIPDDALTEFAMTGLINTDFVDIVIREMLDG